MTRAKAEKIKRGIEDKIRKSTVDMEWWADFWGFTVDEYEEFLDMAIEALEHEPIIRCEDCKHHGTSNCPMWGDDTTEDYMWCCDGARRESDEE